MKLKIKGNEYELYFGIEFLREIDKRYALDQQGVRLGGGLIQLLPQLRLNSLVAVFDCIQAATKTLHTQPSKADLEAMLVSDETDIEDLATVFTKAFETSPLLMKQMKAMANAVQRVQGSQAAEELETAERLTTES